MPDNESVLLVPLRSNASALLTGTPIKAVRRRLKFASIFFDRVFLEAGVFRMDAGPDGFLDVIRWSDSERTRWQTPRQRHDAQEASFLGDRSNKQITGIPAETDTASCTNIAWLATFHPFTKEWAPTTDWIEFVSPSNALGEARVIAQRFSFDDERNAALAHIIPDQIVRNAVIRNVNHDTTLAAENGLAVSFDPFHAQVAAERFNDDDFWKMHGYVVPILFPYVGDLPWEAIVDLRHDKNIARFRSILRQVEDEAKTEAANGDIEAAAQHAYRQHLAEASNALETVGAVAHRTLTGFVIGGITGFTVSGIIGPLGTLASAALGAIPTTIIDVRNVIRRNRSRGWIAFDHRIEGLRTK